MKYGIVTDTHLGARGGSRVFRQYMSWWWYNCFFPDMKERGITEVIHGGDFFDNRNSISLEDIDFVVNHFCQWLKEFDITMYVIVGNHDTAFRNTNRVHSCSLLKQVAPDNVVLVDNDIETTGPFVMVPWINRENYDEIMGQIEEYSSPDRIMIGHFEIEGMRMYANSMRCEHGLDPELFKGYKKVLSGHFHHPNVHSNIEYIGAAFELNWQDYGDWRGHMVYDTDTGEFERVLNEFQLFNSFAIEDMFDADEDDLKTAVEGQFVRIVINEEHKKIKVKDFVNKVEALKPLKVDIIDHTVVDTSQAVNEDTNVNIQETEEYMESYITDRPDTFNGRVLPLLKDLYSKASEQLKEIE